MEIGNQIRSLRGQKGVTQEAVAAALGVSAQAVSKWETGAALPDIALLPEISAYFGVTIDELFALTEEQRLERIENMLLESRDADPDILEREAGFLLDKGRREPGNWRVRMMLAWMENHRAGTHRRRAEYYAKESLEREAGDGSAHGELAQAVGIALPDWYARSHLEIVDWYKGYIRRRPDDWRAYLWLMDALIADYRLEEAQEYCDRLSKINDTFRVPHYRGLIAFQRGEPPRQAP